MRRLLLVPAATSNVRNILGKSAAGPNMSDEVALFSVLADETRLRLAVLLAVTGETCVCMLAQAVNEPEYKVSRHLGIMRSAGMVEARREGTWMHYRLVEPRTRLEKCLQECFRNCLAGHKAILSAMKRLERAECALE